MIASGKFLSCDNCGVVVDFNNYALERGASYNYDRDMKCVSVKCPVCHEMIPDEEWEECEDQ